MPAGNGPSTVVPTTDKENAPAVVEYERAYAGREQPAVAHELPKLPDVRIFET